MNIIEILLPRHLYSTGMSTGMSTLRAACALQLLLFAAASLSVYSLIPWFTKCEVKVYTACLSGLAYKLFIYSMIENITRKYELIPSTYILAPYLYSKALLYEYVPVLVYYLYCTCTSTVCGRLAGTV